MTTAVAPQGSAVTVCRDPEEFGELAKEWEDLRRRCRPATAFQSHAWLHSWWLSYGRPGRLRVVLVHSDGELVAAAPMMLTYRPLPTLVALGGAITDFCDVLLDDERPHAAHALARALHRTARGAVIDLREVRPGAAAERLYDVWPGSRQRLRDSVCLELPGVSDGFAARPPARPERQADPQEAAQDRQDGDRGVPGPAVGRGRLPCPRCSACTRCSGRGAA